MLIWTRSLQICTHWEVKISCKHIKLWLLFSAKTPEMWSTLRSWHVLVPRHLSSFPWHLVANPLDLTSLLFVFQHSVIYLLVMRSETLSGDSDNQPTFGVAENMPFPPQDSAVLRVYGCYFFSCLVSLSWETAFQADVKTGPHMWMFFHVATKWELAIKAVTAFKLLHVKLEKRASLFRFGLFLSENKDSRCTPRTKCLLFCLLWRLWFLFCL